MVGRIWRTFGLKPHLTRSFKISPDPQLVNEVRDAVGLYMNPPNNAVAFGSKHHVLTDAHGIPVVARLTSANWHDVTQLLPLVDGIPPLRGCPGRPLRKPGLVQGDRGYDSQPHRDELARRGIASQLANGAAHTVADLGGRDGSSNAHSRGCIAFVASTCATNGVHAFMKRSSPWRAPWCVGTISSRSVNFATCS
jgi:hypothetical protein